MLAVYSLQPGHFQNFNSLPVVKLINALYSSGYCCTYPIESSMTECRKSVHQIETNQDTASVTLVPHISYFVHSLRFPLIYESKPQNMDLFFFFLRSQSIFNLMKISKSLHGFPTPHNSDVSHHFQSLSFILIVKGLIGRGHKRKNIKLKKKVSFSVVYLTCLDYTY